MLTEYLPIVFLLFLGLVVGGVMVGLSWWMACVCWIKPKKC